MCPAFSPATANGIQLNIATIQFGQRAWTSLPAGLANLVMAILSVLLLDLPSFAQPLYRVTDLGNLPAAGETSLAYGINDLGQVVGMACANDCDERGRGFLWTSGIGMQDLGSLPGGGEYVVAYGINNNGQVVGVSDDASTKGLGGRAFIWNSTNGMQDLGDMPGGEYRSGAFSINESGHIAGTSASYESGYRAFFWSPETGKRNLGHLQSDGYDYSQGIAINDNGDVVGSSHVASGGHAFLWTQSSGMLDLGTLPGGGTFSDAWGINNSGQIVGTSATVSGHHAYLRTVDGVMHDLGDLPGGDDQNIGVGINDGGQVVGYGISAGGQVAFLWTSDGGMQDLNTLLEASGEGWYLREATAINNVGQIVGNGTNPSGDDHAFLLTPVGQPGDINLDGIVNRLDVALFAQHFGTAIGATWIMGDFTGDGRTSLDDLSILQRHLYSDGSVQVAPASSVPEPSTMLCLLAGVGVLALRLHRRCREERPLSYRDDASLV